MITLHSISSQLRQLLVTANVIPSSPILVILMMEVLHSPESWFFQELQGLISQKTALFVTTAVKTSNLTTIMDNMLENFINICSVTSRMQRE
jgi:hypothetical protein